MIAIREEIRADVDAREQLLDAAFGPARFQKTCERLREGRRPALALTAQDASGRLVGSVRLWHVSAGPGRPALLLGPLAVDGARRAQGIGGRLTRQALDRAAAQGHTAVLLVGDQSYYGRFGFGAAPEGLWLPGPVDCERFLALELAPGALAGARGLVSPTGPAQPRTWHAWEEAQRALFARSPSGLAQDEEMALIARPAPGAGAALGRQAA